MTRNPLIPLRESLTVEFKSDRSPLPDKDLVEALVAMANTEGGVLFLGVEDDGTVTGLHKSHESPGGLVAMVANNTVPSVAARAEMIESDGKRVMRVEAYPSRSIIATSGGKILRRRLKFNGEPENIPLFYHEIAGRLSDLSLLDYSAQPVLNSSLEDIDPLERERLRRFIRLRRGGDASLLDLSDEELDKALGMTTEIDGKQYVTVCGLLLAGKEERLRKLLPTAKAAFTVLDGMEVRFDARFARTIPACIEEIETFFRAQNKEKEFEYGLIRIPIPDFSEDAFREGLVNAFSHRDYSMLGEVIVQINEEGLSISNPGGFIEGVNIHNFLVVPPRGRNPLLSDALKRLGLAEKTGRGIDRIFKGSITYGRPWPDYSRSTERFVELFIPRSDADIEFMRMILDEQEREGKELPFNTLLVLSCIRSGRRLSAELIREATGIDTLRLTQILEDQVESGLLEVRDEGNNRTYSLSARLYQKRDKEYVRQHPIDEVRFPEMILQLAAKQDGSVTRSDVEELLHVNSSAAASLIRDLRKRGKLEIEKRGKYASYKLVE